MEVRRAASDPLPLSNRNPDCPAEGWPVRQMWMVLPAGKEHYSRGLNTHTSWPYSKREEVLVIPQVHCLRWGNGQNRTKERWPWALVGGDAGTALAFRRLLVQESLFWCLQGSNWGQK